MKLYDKIQFTVRPNGHGIVMFISPVEPGDYELLGYIFWVYAWNPDRTLDLAVYDELLQEVESVESGLLERGMEIPLADYGNSGELIIGRETTVFVQEVSHKRVEMPTSVFKQLIFDWLGL
jgi:hypothetical protein